MNNKKIIICVLLNIFSAIKLNAVCGQCRRATNPLEIILNNHRHNPNKHLESDISDYYLEKLSKGTPTQELFGQHSILLQKVSDTTRKSLNSGFANAILEAIDELPNKNKVVKDYLKICYDPKDAFLTNFGSKGFDDFDIKNIELPFISRKNLNSTAFEAIIIFLGELILNKENPETFLPFLTSDEFRDFLKDESFLNFLWDEKNICIAQGMLAIVPNLPIDCRIKEYLMEILNPEINL
jgi:hypothetical protein